MATGALGLVGMWRNVTPVVAPVADLNNYLLPLWMLVLGSWLVLASRSSFGHERPGPPPSRSQSSLTTAKR